jgi:hypothetical protein
MAAQCSVLATRVNKRELSSLKGLEGDGISQVI